MFSSSSDMKTLDGLQSEGASLSAAAAAAASMTIDHSSPSRASSFSLPLQLFHSLQAAFLSRLAPTLAEQFFLVDNNEYLTANYQFNRRRRPGRFRWRAHGSRARGEPPPAAFRWRGGGSSLLSRLESLSNTKRGGHSEGASSTRAPIN